MKKRIFELGTVAMMCCIAAGCDKTERSTVEGKLVIGFAEPLEVVKNSGLTNAADVYGENAADAYDTNTAAAYDTKAASAYNTKAAAAYDTNAFILSVKSNSGETIYRGVYGQRPPEMTLQSGTYEVDVTSHESDVPAFEKPKYGDHQIVVVSGGKTASVQLVCRLVNSGIRLNLTESFKKRYKGGRLVLKQEAGSLEYGESEKRTGYFKGGNVAFTDVTDTEEVLFNKVVSPGEIYNITLNASCSESDAGFSITVDESAEYISETITVGDESYEGADGTSPEKALDITKAALRQGDTLWVWGYVVGGDLTTAGISFSAPFTKSSNIAIAMNGGETSRANCFSVELSKTAVKNALNLVDHPENLGRKVFLKGEVSEYFSLPGLKKVSDFKFEDTQ